MRRSCTKLLSSSALPPLKPAAGASSLVLRSVSRSSISIIILAVAEVLTALSCAVGRWSDSVTLLSRRTLCSGATASRPPSSIRSSTRISPTVATVSPFCKMSPGFRARLKPCALTAKTVPLPVMEETVANSAMMISGEKKSLGRGGQDVNSSGRESITAASVCLLDFGTHLRKCPATPS